MNPLKCFTFLNMKRRPKHCMATNNFIHHRGQYRTVKRPLQVYRHVACKRIGQDLPMLDLVNYVGSNPEAADAPTAAAQLIG
jgi:hypothetical protein